ncbi:hypothetical protein [Nocardioides convexus]|uniref:hypothetical protein n=1 Tax=Nocardioides convexus TaxID=2712224 RepID=UPI002418AC79|nr:hypothetical protein [Nocardioides convexus]
MAAAVGVPVAWDTPRERLREIADAHGITGAEPERGPGSCSSLYEEPGRAGHRRAHLLRRLPHLGLPADPGSRGRARTGGALGPRGVRDGARDGVQRA